MIDEVDLHLHPKWQREMVQRLRNVFPNCQFLLSTHSPHVMTHVERENIYLIGTQDGAMIAHRPSESFGKSSEQILEDVMGLATTRPDNVADDLGEVFRLIDRNEIDAAKNLIGKLEKQIGSDHELVRASALIRRKEILGQ